MRKTTAAALLAATAAALAYSPTRRWIASVLILTGAHIDHGPDDELTPEQRRRMRRAIQAGMTARNGQYAGPI